MTERQKPPGFTDLVDNGAPKEILYMNKPHLGTDVLIQIVKI